MISVFSPKGGVSKTSLAMNIALHKSYYFVENDPFGGVSEVLNEQEGERRAFLVDDHDQKIPLMASDNVVYDFGCCNDRRSHAILRSSDLVIVPTLHSYSDIKATLSAIIFLRRNLDQHAILVVINKVDTRGKTEAGSYIEYEKTRKQLEKVLGETRIDNETAALAGNTLLEGVEFAAIRKSKVWSMSTNQGRSIIDIYEQSPLNRRRYQGAVDDFETLIKRIERL